MPKHASASTDTVFELIQQHRQCYEATNIEIVKTDQWEAAIPSEGRKTKYIEDGACETDDPRWLAHLGLMHKLHEAESNAARVCALKIQRRG